LPEKTASQALQWLPHFPTTPVGEKKHEQFAFDRVARTFLKNIRVNSKQELKERILLGIKEINDSPVVHRWKKFDFAHAF